MAKAEHASFRDQLVQAKDALIAAHLTGIGGSESGVVAGVSTWCTPLELWARKRRLQREGEDWVMEAPTRDPRYWGQRLEPTVLQDWCFDVGMDVIARDRDGQVVRFLPDGRVLPWAVDAK